MIPTITAVSFALAVTAAALFLPAACGSPRAQDFSQSVLETRIRDILSIPTHEHVYRDVVYAAQETRFLGIKTKENRTLFSIEIVVQAGLNLSRGFELDLRDGNSAAVSLPPSEILEIDADERTITQYFSKEQGGGIERLAYYDEINAKKSLLREDAIARGILLKADENAQKLIRNLLEFAGYERIDFIVFPDGTLERQPGGETPETENG